MWFTTSREHPTIALNVSWSNGGQKTEEAATTTKKAPAVELVDIDDEIEREQGFGYADSTARTPPRSNRATASGFRPRRGCSHTVENACTGEESVRQEASEEQSPCKDTALAGAE